KALIIEEGAIPGAVASILPIAMYAASRASGDRAKTSTTSRVRQLAQIMLGSYRGPIDRTLTYLIMSTDDSGGQVVLDNDRIHLKWPDVAEQPVLPRDHRIAALATQALGGTAVPDPVWAWTRGRSLITVHPLGGCVMADDATTGVVDHKGRVFDPTCDGVHEGLYVSDGSVTPLALDANALLTISAIADGTAEMLIADRKWMASQPGSVASPPPKPPREAATTASLSFTERLTGFMSMHTDGGDFLEAFEC